MICNFFLGLQPEAVRPWPTLQLAKVLEMYLLLGCWCYQDVTYHFGKHLVC